MGGDPACQHVWVVTPPRRDRNEGDNKSPHAGEIQRAHDGASYDAIGGKLCSKCNGWFGQLGAEPTPQMYTEHLVMVFRELWRVLRDDGVFWLNLGDSYNNSNGFSRATNGWEREGRLGGAGDKKMVAGFRPKALFGIPWRVAFALQDDGWILRSDCIWYKRNPMPDSVKDRPTRAHEYVFMFTKNEQYYYDQNAERIPNPRADETGAVHGIKGDGHKAETTRNDHGNMVHPNPAGANMKTVWDIPVRPYHGAHFATFPPQLPARCIRLSTSTGGVCARCGAPYERVIEKGAALREWQKACGGDGDGEYDGEAIKEYEGTGAQNPSEVKARILAGLLEKITKGWEPTCDHPKGPTVPCVVMDVFAGSGTTLVEAHRQNRRSIGIELSDEYVKQIEARLAPEMGLEDEF
jgi:site-specific DNA-methyltransferase (adenine-specific)